MKISINLNSSYLFSKRAIHLYVVLIDWELTFNLEIEFSFYWMIMILWSRKKVVLFLHLRIKSIEYINPWNWQRSWNSLGVMELKISRWLYSLSRWRCWSIQFEHFYLCKSTLCQSNLANWASNWIKLDLDPLF